MEWKSFKPIYHESSDISITIPMTKMTNGYDNNSMQDVRPRHDVCSHKGMLRRTVKSVCVPFLCEAYVTHYYHVNKPWKYMSEIMGFFWVLR